MNPACQNILAKADWKNLARIWQSNFRLRPVETSFNWKIGRKDGKLRVGVRGASVCVRECVHKIMMQDWEKETNVIVSRCNEWCVSVRVSVYMCVW